MKTKHIVATAFLAFGLISPMTAFANDATMDALKGEWKVKSKSTAKKSIKKAVEVGAESANFFIRGIAKDRLTNSTRLCDSIVFDFKADNALDVKCKRKSEPFTHKLKAKGTKKNVKGKWDVTTKYPAGTKPKLKQVYQVRGEENKRVNTYVINEDGSMTMLVRIVSTSLDKDVTYRITYVR